MIIPPRGNRFGTLFSLSVAYAKPFQDLLNQDLHCVCQGYLDFGGVVGQVKSNFVRFVDLNQKWDNIKLNFFPRTLGDPGQLAGDFIDLFLSMVAQILYFTNNTGWTIQIQ